MILPTILWHGRTTWFEVQSEGGYKDHNAKVESLDPEASHVLSSEKATPLTWFPHHPPSGEIRFKRRMHGLQQHMRIYKNIRGTALCKVQVRSCVGQVNVKVKKERTISLWYFRIASGLRRR
jgi:hypothetical protein